MLDYSDNSKRFWLDFLFEKNISNSELHKLILFLQFSLHKEYTKYANRFPILCGFITEILLNQKKNIFCEKDISISTINSNLSREDVRCIYIHDVDYSSIINININRPIIFFDNLCEPLAYFIFQSSKIKKSILIEYLTSAGFTKEKSKKIVNLSSELYKYINEHVERKVSSCIEKNKSLSNTEKEINYFEFFHRECCKRRFYIDLVNNENNLIYKVNSFVNIFCNGIMGKQKRCTSCIFDNKDMDEGIKNTYKSDLAIQCERGFCKLKSNFVNIYLHILQNDNLGIKNSSFPGEMLKIMSELKDIYDTYGYSLFDLLSLQNPEYICKYYKRYGVLPYKNYIHKEIETVSNIYCYSEFDNGDIKSENTGNNYKKYKDSLVLSIKMQKKDGKHVVDVDSFLIGLYIWDQKNIFESKDSIFRIVDGMRLTGLGDIISERHNCATANSYEKRDEDTETKQVKDYCNDCYIRVKESIFNEGCKLLSIEEARKRHRSCRG